LSLIAWLTLCGVCLAGAMSPGPSLAVVVQSSLSSGRRAGVIVAISHGAGIFIWAMLTAGGVGLVLAGWPEVYGLLRLMGSLFLVYLGIRNFKSNTNSGEPDLLEHGPTIRPLIDGFLIAITNPKIALFFLALFSQFVRVDADLSEKVLMAATAAIIDALWYSAVALLLSNSKLTNHLVRKKRTIDRIFGVILISLAISIWVAEFS